MHTRYLTCGPARRPSSLHRGITWLAAIIAICAAPYIPSMAAARAANAAAPAEPAALGPYAFTQDFLGPLDELVQAALAEGAQNWQTTVPILDEWKLQSYEVLPLSDGKRAITVYLQAAAQVSYRTVEVCPPPRAQIVTVRHQLPRSADPTTGLLQACDAATALARQNAPVGKAVDGALTGKVQRVLTTGIWPFYLDTYAQSCTLSYRITDTCLEMTGHPKACAYLCHEAEVAMAQQITCEFINNIWSCAQIHEDSITPPLAKCLESLLNRRGKK
jgi:hypothetical protein